MKGIGGNVIAVIQTKITGKNAIGEQVEQWVDTQGILGWLDLMSGDAKYTEYNAKMQNSTHVFVADYVPLASAIKAENSRMIVNNSAYDIMLIDNPMEMRNGSQLEIYLKYTGGL